MSCNGRRDTDSMKGFASRSLGTSDSSRAKTRTRDQARRRPLHEARARVARRIALYYPWIYLTSGAERTILELIAHSRHEWTVFTNHYDRAATFPGFADRRVVELTRVPVKRSMRSVAVAAWHIVTQRLPLEEFEALVIVSEGLGDLVVFRNADRPVLCICLTPLRPVFDEKYRDRALAARGRIGRLAYRAGALAFKALDRLAWRKYERLFCISAERRRRAMVGGVAVEEKLDVVHVGLGVRADKPSDRFEPFFLIPGRIMWTKNLELGIEAFRRFAATEQGGGFRLVIAGMVDAKSRPYLERLRGIAADLPNVEFRHAPSDAELADLYARCYGVIFPAFNEDWGIVPLEALAFGKPVVATDSGGPREVLLRGIHGFLESPDPAAFAARLVELASNPLLARRMGRAGFHHVARFSWERYAQ